MKKSTKRLLGYLLSLLMVFGACFGNVGLITVKAEAETPTVWVVGDSTVSAFTDNYYYPRYGYGTQLQNFLEGVTVNNLALSGRSSKSFTTESNYTTLKNGIKAGDFLIIGFGHNDEKAEADRYTNPNGDYTTPGSFANSIYEKYVKVATSVGATPIVCTPIVRRVADDTWSNSALHITSASGAYEGGDYPEALRKMCTTLNIPLVDMTAKTQALYTELGSAETVNLHAWTSSKSASVDNTHTNIWGANVNAYLIAKEVSELNVPGLAEHVIASKIASMPTKAETLVSNPDYKEVAYDNNIGNSELWDDFGIYKGTVFGDVGGATAVTKSNFSLGKDAKGDMNIVTKGKGKISGTTDGIAFYYYKVPATSVFSLTADMTVNSFTANDQVAFGLMARDDIYLDVYNNSTLGDYVAASPLYLVKGAYNCYARKSGKITSGGSMANGVKAGETYSLSIVSNSDGYACTFGDEKTVTGGFDFALTSIDSEYVYVGMFCARQADVTFKNIKLVVDGVEIDENTPVPSKTPATTQAPVATTQAPVTTTQAPVATTQTPATTETPVAPSQVPTTTETPVTPSQVPAEAKNGLVFEDNMWKYYVNNAVDTSYTGLVFYVDTYFYVTNGAVDFSYTGLAELNGFLFTVTNGVFDASYNTLVFHNGEWYNVINGFVDPNFTSLVYFGDAWFYVKNGKVDFSYTGLVEFGSAWFYINNGMIDWSYTGLAELDGYLFNVKEGILDLSLSGVNNFNGTWYYLENGVVAKWYTSLAQYDGIWFYVNAGVLDFSYTGLVNFNGIWFYVTNGVLDTYYTGLTCYGGAWFYVTGGQLDWNYTGTCMYDGYNFAVVGGMVTGLA